MKARRCVTLIGLFSATVVGGCDNGPTPTDPAQYGDLTITALSTASSTTVGTAVNPIPTFLVTRGTQPAANVRVNFAATGGDIIDADNATGADGIARVHSWKLGARAGIYHLVATLNDRGRIAQANIAAVAVADKVTRLAWIDSVAITLDGARLTVNIGAYDRYANAVTGVRVGIAITRADGTRALDSALTDIGGLAHFEWVVTDGVTTITASESSGISSTYTFKTVDASVLLAGTYELESVSYWNFTDTTLKSTIVLKPDGSFTVDVKGIAGSGKFIVTNDGIIFQYAGDFLNQLFEKMSWAPNSWVSPPSNLQGEHAVLRFGNLIFYRCLTEDCYDATWTYRPVR
ncbi:MAG TPA: hypothetical protein VM099_09230 [Gemmatimonadaceae bacterium]|nr:hypothetical protein [Gemmatimonadaceae bacterium]